MDKKIDVIIDNIDNLVYEEKAIKIIQSLVRGRNVRKIKSAVHNVLNSPDTVRISTAKFPLPLYIVQQTFFHHFFGKKFWEKLKSVCENSIFLYILFIGWFFSITLSGIGLFDNNNNLFLISFAFPLYIFYYLSLQNQLLLLILSTFHCKIYVILTIAFCISMSDLFRDLRIITVWLNIFPSIMLIPLADALPRYLKSLRTIFLLVSFTFLLYSLTFISGVTTGWIDVNDREFVINSMISKKNNTNTIKSKISNLTYCFSLLHTLIILVLKNILWALYNKDRAIVLKSSVLITNIHKIKGKDLEENIDSSYIKIINSNHHLKKFRTSKINKLKVPNSFPFYNNI